MHNEYDSKGMISVTIVLLTHKMTAQFEAVRFNSKEITPDMICDEVEMVGFDCELAGITEISPEDLQPVSLLLKGRPSVKGELGLSFQSDYSLDSARVRGEDDEEIIDESNLSQQKLMKSNNASKTGMKSTMIKIAKIAIAEDDRLLTQR